MKFSHLSLFVVVLILLSFHNVTISDDATNNGIDVTILKSMKSKYDSKIKFPLPHLLDQYYSNQLNAQEFTEYANSVGFQADGYNVQVVIEFNQDTENLATESIIEQFDIQNSTLGKKWLRGFIPISNLEKIANSVPEIYQIEQPRYVNKTVTTEGLALVGAPVWQSAGYTGSGVKVAIIDSGFQHISSMITAGDFTSSFTTRDFTGSGFPGTGDHGTECASIVYDFVPDATFYLIIIANDGDFEQAKDYCIANGIDVISMSLGWLGYWYGDGQGGVCDVANELASNGILLVNSAGNHAENQFWSGTWSDSDADDLMEFSGTDETNSIQLSRFENVSLRLTWDTSLRNSDQDYDLFLLDSSFNVVASSSNDQTGTQQPLEMLSYNAASTGTYHVIVNRYNANGTSNFRLYCDTENLLEYAGSANSILDPGTATGAFTVGAIAYYSWNSSTVPIEYFSSRGPTSDGRIKPDICGPDGTTAHYGSGSFYGTSGACPHVAGAAAIYWSYKLTSTHTQVRTYLENNAIDCGSAGKDNTFGYGKLELGIPGPDKVILVSPPNNSVDQPLTINFQWQQPSGSPTAYQLQVGTDSGFTSTIFDNSAITSTTQQVSGLSTDTKYYWRVRATNGFWGEWSDVWNFNTIVLPEQVTLTSPADNALGQVLSINFQWQQPTIGTQPFTYQLQVSTSNGFTSTLFDSNSITTTSQQVSGLSYDTTYYWRVRAINVAGMGQWSAVWEFETIVTPGQIILSSPTDKAVDQALSPNLQWNAPSTGTAPFTYQLQVAIDDNFNKIIFDSASIGSTSQLFTGLLPGSTYFWKVRANNPAGWGIYSQVWQFTTITPPSYVSLVSPAFNEKDLLTNVTFSWDQPAQGTLPITYHLQVSTSENFASTVFDDDKITTTSQQVTGLSFDTVYYWRVNAVNDAGESGFSDTWQFSTASTPGTVELVSPLDNVDAQPETITFEWQEPSTGSKPFVYQLQISESDAFASTLYDNDNISSLTQQVSGLEYDKVYYWQVRAKNKTGWGNYSTIRKFATLELPGDVIQLVPVNENTKRPVNLSLAWEGPFMGTEPFTYHVQVATDDAFTAIVYDEENIESFLTHVEELEYKTMYYWRVRALNDAGFGAWSETWSFTTGSKPSSGGCSFDATSDGKDLNTFWLAIIFLLVLVAIRKFKH